MVDYEEDILESANPTFKTSIEFKPSKKMKILHWKGLPTRKLQNRESLWRKCIELSEVITVDEQQIIDLFSDSSQQTKFQDKPVIKEPEDKVSC